MQHLYRSWAWHATSLHDLMVRLLRRRHPMSSSRRNFLKTSALAAGAAGVAAIAAPEVFAQRGGGTPTGPLPESITSLKSMRDQAKPISPEERMGRIEKARKLMAANKLSALMLMGGTSMDYFCGVRWGQS